MTSFVLMSCIICCPFMNWRAIMVVLPGWLDQVPKIDFTPEKSILAQLERLAEASGWTVTDGRSLPEALRERTDVLFEHPDGEKIIRAAVLQKSRSGSGMIRLDSSIFRTVELVYLRRKHRWRVEIGSVPIEEEDDVLSHGWDWL